MTPFAARIRGTEDWRTGFDFKDTENSRKAASVKRQTYRAATFVSLGALAIVATQREAIQESFYSMVNFPGQFALGDFFRSGSALTASALLTIAFAFLWVSTKDST